MSRHLLLLTLVYFFVLSCNGAKKEKSKLYNIPEIDKLTAEIAKNPKNAALYATRSALFSQNDLLNEAEIDAEKALSLDSTNLEYYLVLTDAYFDNNHSHAAIKTIQKAIGKFPNDTKLYLNLAEMQMLVEQYNDCMLTLDMLFKIQPENPNGIFLKGQVLKLSGDTTNAIKTFEKVVALDADHINSYMELALYYNKNGNPLTLRYLDNALRIDSTHEGALLTKAQYYHFKSQYEEAKNAYEYAILKHPQNADFNYNLALMYLEMGDELKKKGNKAEAFKKYESAFRHFDNSTKFDVQFADAYFYKGIASERLEKNEVAAIDYENALRLQTYLETVLPETVEESLARVK
jgi:tetratricopeptide (TPR) repeat protein